MTECEDPHPANATAQLLARANDGDQAAREQLINRCCERLERLARKMLAGFPNVRRWEQTGDVLQNASIRLIRSLEQVKPETSRHFFALAGTQIRRELIDMARHYRSAVAGHASLESQRQDGDGRRRAEPIDLASSPEQLVDWTALHEHIASLPDEEREVCELLWYQGMSQSEASAILEVPLRTLKRRWQKVRLKLHDKMEGQFP